jgi:nucleosome binding factor SPN SPT16 subunit
MDIPFQVDNKHESVLLPIYGILVPFHILMIKNASATQENEHHFIRINFNFGTSWEPGALHPKSITIKEMSFRTANAHHATSIVRDIKTLKSLIQQRDKEKAERATLVKQEKLIHSKVGVTLFEANTCDLHVNLLKSLLMQSRVHSLKEIWMRPAFAGKGRKVPGQLEAHVNGFRYRTPKGEEVDVMYRYE